MSGASDDDPSGIATYSQAGAKFGLGMLWLAIFQYPLITVIQEMCARIGLATGDGIAGIMRRKYSKKVVFPLVSLLLVSNTVNIGADIGAMAASVRLIFPQIPIIIVTISFAAFILGAEILMPYEKYIRILRYLTLSLFAYVATALIVGGNATQILYSSVIPHVEFTKDYVMMFVAIFGTTISPYLFFWQASEESEEDVAKHKIKEIGHGKPKTSRKEVKIMRMDVAVGMAFSIMIMSSIIVTTAGSLHARGVTDVSTSEEAAKALQPLVKTFPYSGEIAEVIFALGIIGTGLLAIPVLAGSSAYAISDTLGWKQGLGKKFKQAKPFYLVIAVSTLIGLGINFVNIDPIKALIYTAVINGITAVPILFAILRIANDKKILEDKTNGLVSNLLGWLTFLIMGISVIILFFTWSS
ncbi:MAG TPA: divalent metal cation transporter [Nitrososphaeraceae archaeon]|nr:divalent metal cation transporter [Nitrososphaeraceae archaeon]